MLERTRNPGTVVETVSLRMRRPDDIRISHLVALIEARFDAPCSVDLLARTVNMSPSYLTRLFREQTGRSPASFVREVRLRRAYELVQTTFLSIKEVMAAVGWNDPSHFSRDFRRRFGLSPRALRAQRSAGARVADQHADPPTKTRIRQHYAHDRCDDRNET